MMVICPQAGHWRGSHSLCAWPGLHSSPERGIKTITGSEGNAPESAPAKAHGSAAPPSLLSIRIHAEKESHPAFFSIDRFLMTPTSKIILSYKFTLNQRFTSRTPPRTQLLTRPRVPS